MSSHYQHRSKGSILIIPLNPSRGDHAAGNLHFALGKAFQHKDREIEDSEDLSDSLSFLCLKGSLRPTSSLCSKALSGPQALILRPVYQPASSLSCGTSRFNNQPALSLVGSADSTISQLPLVRPVRSQ